MADPFAVALAALFNAPGSAAAAFTPFPGAAALPIRIIRSQDSQTVAYGDSSAVLDTNAVQIQRSQVADPAGGKLAIGTELFAIQGAPRLDRSGLTWTCNLEPA